MSDATTELLVLQLLDTAAALQRGLDNALSNARGISFSEYRLLDTLSRSSSGALPRVALAKAVSLTPSAVTRAIKPLEKLGLISTVKNERDARQSLAQITAGGSRLLADTEQVLEDFHHQLEADTLTPELIDVLIQQLKRLHSAA